MKRPDYMPCNHCGALFTGTASQRKHFFSSEKRPAYCSGICIEAARAARKKSLPLWGPCPMCGKTFESRYRKIYCSMECYVSSPQWKAQLAANVVKAHAARAKMRVDEYLARPKRHCLECDREFEGRKKKKFCTSTCYRAYMEKRFDRWISSPQRIGVLQGYDEFLNQEELPCVIEGCGWVGHQLSNHMNFAHGVQADEFKRAAGFNKNTGVVSRPLRESLEAREHIHSAPGFPDTLRVHAVIPPRSREANEHYAKSRALMHATPGPKRICAGCGREFQQKSVAGLTKFCGIPCRNEWWREKRKVPNALKPKDRPRRPDGSFLPKL